MEDEFKHEKKKKKSRNQRLSISPLKLYWSKYMHMHGVEKLEPKML